ncbi:MAG: polyprenyl synthetase family protein, partial [Rhodospirillaceae bacterium]|nr:polyprenyl synthetase family protein [Rhodospirillales bacterium]
MAIVVSLEEERGKKAKSFDALVALVKDDLEKVNRQIVERMHSPVELIPQLAGHLIAAGGKRLRPVLTLASARLAGHKG